MVGCCVPRAIDYKVLKALNTGSLYFASLSLPVSLPLFVSPFLLAEATAAKQERMRFFFSVSGHVGVVHVYIPSIWCCLWRRRADKRASRPRMPANIAC